MAGDHPRNTGPMMESSRCGAKTRSGTPCKSPAVSGKKRCRMHGGAKGSGAQRGNTNALKHGWYSAEFVEMRREVNEILRSGRATLKELK
ncbi:hypothetical protein NHF40_12045 [Maricaulaceae bacterium EIL42A08]|nr:hypothetical protein [Maricaulaceae bacterium EIL42A08]